MGYEVWKTIDNIDRKKYLYHYTTMETAYKILYNKTLRFASVLSTNDIFEQKPKIKFEVINNDNIEKVRLVREYLSGARSKIKIVCFSLDSDYDEEKYRKMCKYISKDEKRANIIGRGFALPRMWAQYANNSCGVCFIFDKSKLLKSLDKQLKEYKAEKVEYVDSYIPHLIANEELEKMYDIIKSPKEETLNSIVYNNSVFIKYNYFYKLSDWQSEREFRIITTTQNEDEIIEIKNINEFLCGAVLGHNVDNLHEKLIRSLVEENFNLRHIYFEDTITCVKNVN